MNDPKQMQRGLKNRHLQMIALGGAIGTGLFYGSTAAISMAGPAVAVSYLLGGIVIFLIMRMLGEMAVEEPVSASFAYYASKYWGAFPGFMVGWNYYFNYVIVSMAELSVVGVYVNYWFPAFPEWLSALICLVVITGLNLVTVRLYGELEFWMALVKIVAIVGMIVLGLYLLWAAGADATSGMANLWRHGGFFPNGVEGMCLSLAVVMFSFGGIELIGITAGEAHDPDRTIPQAINQVIWRILIFYVGTMLVLMALWPWNEVGKEASPFVQIFSNVGIPAAAHILNFVVLTAAISVYNSAIYSNSRMLYGLAVDGDAPKRLAKLSPHGVPAYGILFSSGITLIVVAANYFFPGEVFMYFLAIATAAAVIDWVMIAVTHMKFRQTMAREGKTAKFQSLGYPYLNYACLLFLAMVIVMMAQIEGMRLAIIILPLWLIALYIAYCLRRGNRTV